MSLSPDTLLRLEAAHEHEREYRPNNEIQRELGSRSLVMVVAPAAMGKTFLMHALVESDERFGLSRTVSSRKPREDDDPDMFRLIEHDDENLNVVLNKIDDGTMVQYTIHPSEGTFYGSELQDHPHGHNLLATLSGAVDQLTAVGFGQTTLIGLVAPPTTWQRWFNERYPIGDAKRLGRLNEASKSYRDLLGREDVTWIINNEGLVEDAVQDVIDAVDNKPNDKGEALAYANRILQLIEQAKLLEYTGTNN